MYAIRILGAHIDINKPGHTLSNYPLHWACAGGYIEIVEYLLGRGADVNVKNRWDETPLMLAESNRRRWIVRMLRDHGAMTTTRSEDLSADTS